MIAKMIVVIVITQPYRNERLKAYNTLLDIHKLHKTFKFTKKTAINMNPQWSAIHINFITM